MRLGQKGNRKSNGQTEHRVWGARLYSESSPARNAEQEKSTIL